MADGAAPSRLTLGRVMVAFVIVIIAGALLTPNTNPESGGRLTTFASDPGGTRGLFEVVRRLGWPVARHVEPFQAPLDTTAIYVILEPPIGLTSLETSVLLDAVRRGAGLLLVPGTASAIADSLGIEQVETTIGPHEMVSESAWDSLGVRPTTRWPFSLIEVSDSAPASVVTLLPALRFRVRAGASDTLPLVVGIPTGRGRIAVLGDGGILINSQLRRETHAVLPVRLLEWIAPGRKPLLIFAEYHQGYGRHASVMRSVRTALFGTPAGRTGVQLLAAGAVLLLVFGIRPIAPRARARVERRSPIEHVGALAHAYAQVGATRTATRRLVHGLRRRHPIGTLRTATDEEYLASLAARHPAVAPHVELLVTASSQPQPPDRFREAGAAVAHIERILST